MHELKASPSIENEALTGPDRLIGVGLVVGVLVTYLATRLQVLNQLMDAALNAAIIQGGKPQELFRASHLIYLSLVRWVFQSLAPQVPGLGAVAVAEVLGGLLGSLAVGVFYLLARSFLRERWLSIALSLALAFSYKYWLVSAGVDVHGPSAVFYLLSLLVALRTPRGAPARQHAVLGVLTALAILVHAFAAAVGLAVVVLTLLRNHDPARTPHQPKSGQLRALVVYGLTTVICVVTTYTLVVTQGLHLRTTDEILSWIMEFQSDAGLHARAALPLLGTLAAAMKGIAHALLGFLAWGAAPGVRETIAKAFPDRSLVGALYVIRNLPPAIALALTALGVAATSLLAVLVLLSLPGLARALRRGSRVGIALIIGLIASLGPQMYAAPEDAVHWAVFCLPILLLAMGLGLEQTIRGEPERRRLVQRLIASLVVCLFLANLGNIVLLADADNDIYHRGLEWYQANAAPEDLIVVSGESMRLGYTAYYLPQAQVANLGQLFRRMDYPSAWRSIQAQIQLAQARGGRVFVMQDALEPEPALARTEGWDLAAFASFRRDIMPRLDCFPSDYTSVCEVVR